MVSASVGIGSSRDAAPYPSRGATPAAPRIARVDRPRRTSPECHDELGLNLHEVGSRSLALTSSSRWNSHWRRKDGCRFRAECPSIAKSG